MLCRHLDAKDPRVSVAAATQILDRAYGRPPQTIDANINEDSSIRYYAEVPRLAATTEEWIQGNPVPKKAVTTEEWPAGLAPQRNPESHDDEARH